MIICFCRKAKNTDEARTTFQLARNNVKGFAMVYVSWAQFELDQGKWCLET